MCTRKKDVEKLSCGFEVYNKIKLFFVIYDKPAFNTLFSFKE